MSATIIQRYNTLLEEWDTVADTDVTAAWTAADLRWVARAALTRGVMAVHDRNGIQVAFYRKGAAVVAAANFEIAGWPRAGQQLRNRTFGRTPQEVRPQGIIVCRGTVNFLDTTVAIDDHPIYGTGTNTWYPGWSINVTDTFGYADVKGQEGATPGTNGAQVAILRVFNLENLDSLAIHFPTIGVGDSILAAAIAR